MLVFTFCCLFDANLILLCISVSIQMSKEEISSADLHPLLQREDTRRANRRKRGIASPNNTLENSR